MGNELSGEEQARLAYGTDVQDFNEKIGASDEGQGYHLPKDVAGLNKLATFLDKAQRTLAAQIQRLGKNQNVGYIQEYSGIHAGERNPATASLDPNNRHLNRYNNIVAYDHSRVKIKPTASTFNSDYINANYIKGYNNDKMYIASQGPVPDSFAGFWQMIWDEKVNVMVMVTNEVENGRLKCHRYWPDPQEGVGQYGDVSVQHSFQEVHPTYVIRHFVVQRGAQHRDIQQFAFTAWPDHGVPATTKELLHFRKAVRDKFKPADGPLLIHCSAGVGRTGTFLGLDRFLEECINCSEIGILKLVEEMRENRNFMVQSQIQFIYLYNVCLDGLTRIYKAITKELDLASMSPEDRAQAQMSEIEGAVKWAENVRTQAVKVVDAKHGEGVSKAEELANASKVPAAARKSSLMNFASPESAHWKSRKNVPLEVTDKGYQVDRAANLEARLQALSDTQGHWVQRYSHAFDAWKTHQTEGGEEYNIEKQLTPLESRLQSLSGAEEAWQYRGDGLRSAKEADVRESLAALTLRLESLQATVMSAESRWRSKGDGMQQAVKDAAGKRISTVDMLGGLTSRLDVLRTEEAAWIERGNVPRYTVETFRAEVDAERKVLEDRRKNQVNAARRASQEQELKERAAAKEKADVEARLAEEQEAKRKSAVKDKMRRKSEQKTEGFDPTKHRTAKEEKAAKKAADAAAKAEKKKQEALEKERKKLEKKKSSENAKKKADKFLNKMRK